MSAGSRSEDTGGPGQDARLEAVIGEIRIFRGLPESVRACLAAVATRGQHLPGEVLFKEGDAGDCLYLIVRGRVQILSRGEDGGDVVVAMRGAGETIGELSLLDGRPRSGTAVVHRPSQLVRLGRDAFLDCLREHSELSLALLTCLAERLRESTRDLARRTTVDIATRTAEALLTIAQSRTAVPRPDGTVLLPAIGQEALARRIGASRESVCRTISTYKRMGLLKGVGRRIQIIDLEKLRQRAQTENA